LDNVYFVAADGAIKIGYSANVSKRMAQLQTGAACKLKLLAIYPGANRAIEQRLHDAFSEYRLEGEWFRDARVIRRFAAAVHSGSRPASLAEIKALIEIARCSKDEPTPAKFVTPEEKEDDRRRKILGRKPTPIPAKFMGTAQGLLISALDAMTRDPDLPQQVYGRSHAALRQALRGDKVDILKAACSDLQQDDSQRMSGPT
jgi:hypothetical protein